MSYSFYKHKCILITGHTGFKGIWSLWLLRLGARVIWFALDPPSIPNNFEVCNLESAVTHIYGDVRNLEQLHGVALASGRAGNVFGGGDWGADRLIPDCIGSILKNESVRIRNPMAIRPWQHVLEPLCGYLMLGQKLYQEGSRFARAWNFGPHDSDAKSVEWVVQRICALRGRKWLIYNWQGSASPHEAGYLKLNCAKVRAELDWHPQWNLDTALEKNVKWTHAYQKGHDVRKVCLK